jgi:hypothetical protein
MQSMQRWIQTYNRREWSDAEMQKVQDWSEKLLRMHCGQENMHMVF